MQGEKDGRGRGGTFIRAEAVVLSARRAKAKESYERGAHAQLNAGSPWHAGRCYENAAQMAGEMGDLSSVADMTREAMSHYSECTAPADVLTSHAYVRSCAMTLMRLAPDPPDAVQASRANAAATALSKGAQRLAAVDPGRAADLYREAIQVAESDMQEHLVMDIYR